MFNNVDEEPDFSLFQVPENYVPKLVASPMPSSAARRVFDRMNRGKKKYTRKSKNPDNTSSSIPSSDLTCNDDFDDIDDVDGLENETIVSGFHYTPPVVEVPKTEDKTWCRWILEEFTAFIICLIYLLGFNILLKAYLY